MDKNTLEILHILFDFLLLLKFYDISPFIPIKYCDVYATNKTGSSSDD
jgi:hypothetical protein